MKSKVLKTSSAKPKEQGNLDHLEDVLKLMEKYEVVDLEWEKGGERIKLSTRGQSSTEIVPQRVSEPQSGHVVVPVDSQVVSVGLKKPLLNECNQKQVLSPFVGVFYRSASPDVDPYVKEGQLIKRGDVLCIIEAMKLMNEIEAELSGKLVSVLVENGQPVEFGEPLFMIEV